MGKERFWYSKRQREWNDYCDANPLFGHLPRPNRTNYALIDGRLFEYTEMSSLENYEGPDYDDAVFLGYGEWACTSWNIQSYLKRHPEVRVGAEDDWPEVIG